MGWHVGISDKKIMNIQAILTTFIISTIKINNSNTTHSNFLLIQLKSTFKQHSLKFVYNICYIYFILKYAIFQYSVTHCHYQTLKNCFSRMKNMKLLNCLGEKNEKKVKHEENIFLFMKCTMAVVRSGSYFSINKICRLINFL